MDLQRLSKWSNALCLRSPLVDEGMVRPGQVGVTALSFLQCSDTDGEVIVRADDP